MALNNSLRQLVQHFQLEIGRYSAKQTLQLEDYPNKESYLHKIPAFPRHLIYRRVWIVAPIPKQTKTNQNVQKLKYIYMYI